LENAFFARISVTIGRPISRSNSPSTPIRTNRLGNLNLMILVGTHMLVPLRYGKRQSYGDGLAGFGSGDGDRVAAFSCCCSERSKSFTDKLSPSMPMNQSAVAASA
jgi:hypothetical protein